MLRKRIAELQHYRRMGLSTVAEIDKYEADVVKRVRLLPMCSLLISHRYRSAKQTQAKTNLSRDYLPERLPQLRPGGRQSSVADARTERGKSHEREATPGKAGASGQGASGTGAAGRKLRTSSSASTQRRILICGPSSRTTQPRKQPSPTPAHPRRADALLPAPHSSQALPRHQRDLGARVCAAWREAASARSA